MTNNKFRGFCLTKLITVKIQIKAHVSARSLVVSYLGSKTKDSRFESGY